MENDLDIFRKREERKKKKKVRPKPQLICKSSIADGHYINQNEVCFLGKDEKSGEALVYLSNGKNTECISTGALDEKMLMNWQKAYTKDL